MRKKLLYIMMILFFGISAKAQSTDTIVIGQGISNTSLLSGRYGWNREALLYKAEEIGTSGLISSIAFYVSTANATIGSRAIKIYLMQTDVYQLSNDFFPSWNAVKEQAVLVYDSVGIAFPVTGWYTFELDELFPYVVSQNLLVLVEGVGCTTGGGCNTNTRYTSAANMAWYGRKNSIAPDDNLPPSSAYGSSAYTNTHNNRSNIRIIMEDTSLCKNVSHLTATNITAHGARIEWQSRGEETSWLLSYKGTGEANWSDNIYVTDPFYEFPQNLYPETQYEVRVMADCGGNTSLPLATLFTTEVSCFSPSGIVVSDITTNSATISWNGYDNAQYYDMVISPVPISNFDTVTPAMIFGTTYTAENLSHSTTYYVYLRTDCGWSDGTSV